QLLLATDGLFYGTGYLGGAMGGGVLYSFNPNSNTYSELVDFNFDNGAGSEGSLMQAGSNMLYGTTDYGGDTAGSPSGNGYGVIFKYDISANTYTDLYHFQQVSGAYPNREKLLMGQNGKLYGLTFRGGSYNYGVIFSYDPSTGLFMDHHNFDSINGAVPLGGMIKGSDGNYYGLTTIGGIDNQGILFKFNPGTNIFTSLYSFSQATGSRPRSSLIKASDGTLYGMTQQGGLNSMGVIFSYDISMRTYAVVFNFTSVSGNPWGSLIESTNGKFYGMTYCGASGADTVGHIFSYDPSLHSISYLHSFNISDGCNPIGDLTETDMNFGVPALSNVSFTISPNPAKDFISVETPTIPLCSMLSILNMAGQELITRQISVPNTIIDIAGLLPGVYFIRLTNEKSAETATFMKQ
ncbi:MAG: T9SS type A sorting domain-containing protein, partial [Bacteroidetes bacterium]|nr:T9SS type A sorting domain-containing protein [Bacteroidota bacterium]